MAEIRIRTSDDINTHLGITQS